MKIQITSAIARDGEVVKKGAELELKDEEAKHLITRGCAKAVSAKAPEKK
jgi:hypothetical protein